MASITDNISEGLKYPFKDVKKLLILGALFTSISLISFGITEYLLKIFRIIAKAPGNSFTFKLSQIPANNIYITVFLALISFIILLIIMGYLYNVIKFSIESKNDFPEFGDVLNLLKNGVKYFVVSFVYNIIPLIVFLVGTCYVNFHNSDYLVSILTFLLSIICNFLLIMALTNMVDADKFTKAFALREIVDKIANLGWIKYMGTVIFTFIIYAIIMAAIGIILMFITMFIALAINKAMIIMAIITVLQGLFISPYISIFFNRVYGSIYREAIK